VPAAVVVLGESGAERYRVYRRFTDGNLKLTLPLAANEAAGRWFVRVTELFSQRSHGTAFLLPARQPRGIVSAAGPTMLFNKRRCADLLKRARSLLLVSGDDAGRDAARELARGLQRFAVNCTLQQDTAALRSGAGEGSLALASDAILLGSPANNLLIRHLAEERLIPVSGDAGRLPAGVAVVFWSRSAFRSDAQTITICADDELGLRHGVETLLKMIEEADDAEEASSARPVKVVQEAAASPEMQAPPEVLPSLFTNELRDSVTGLAAPLTGRFVVAGAVSGDLYALSASGARAWHTLHDLPVDSVLLPGKGSDPLVVSGSAAALYSVVSTQNWRFATPDRPFTAASMSFDGNRIALGTAAGTVVFLTGGGMPLWQADAGGPVDVLACSGLRVAAAANGLLMLFDPQGRPVWRRELERCCRLAFSADGGNLLAGTAAGLAQCRSAADGKTLWEQKMDSPIKGAAITPDGTALIVAESGAVLRFRPDAKEPERLHLGHTVQVFASSADSAWSAAAQLGPVVSVFDSAGEVIRRFSIPGRRISCLAVSPGGRLLFAGDWNGTILAFRID